MLFDGAETTKAPLQITSFTNALKYLSGFASIVSTERNIIERTISANNENFCFDPLAKKAERIAMPKSSRFVSIIHYLKNHPPINMFENVSS